LNRPTPPAWTRGPFAILAVLVAYYVTGWLGLRLAIPPGYATAVWPPSGIALAAMLVCGYRVWPGIVLGSFCLNVAQQLDPATAASVFSTVGVAATIALGAAAQAALATFLVERLVDDPAAFVREEQIIKFLLAAGPVSCLVAPTVGVAALMLGGLLPSSAGAFTWCTWWVGDTIGTILFAPLIVVWIAPSAETTRVRQISVSAPIGVMFGLAVFAFAYASAWEQYRLEQDFARRSDGIVQMLKKALDGHLDALYATRGLFESGHEVDPAAFRQFTERYVARHPGLRALAWGEWTGGGKRGEERALVRYAEPVEENRDVVGADLLADAEQGRALSEARRAGQPFATSSHPLVGDPRPRAGFSIFLPATPRGFVAGVFHVTEMMNASLRGVVHEGIDIAIYEDAGASEKDLLYRSAGSPYVGESTGQAAVSTLVPIEVAGRRWSLALSVPQAWALANRSLQAWTVLASGLSFTALLGAFLLVLTGRTAFVEGVVRERTAELHRAAAERARADEGLRASEERHRMLAEQSSDFISRHRMSGLVTYASPACKALFGFEPSEIVGLSGYDFFHPADIEPAKRVMRAAIDGAGVATINYRTRCKDGRYVWVESSLSVLRDPATGVAHEMLAVSRDVSERKRVERMRQDLVAMLSHDLKNPLTAVLGFAEILRDVPGDDPQHDEFLSRIEANAHAALSLAINFVDASQIESGAIQPRLEPVFLNDIVEHVLRHQESRAKVKQIRVETRLARAAPMALLDRRLIDRVIANLVNNAIKFSPVKTEVRIETAIEDGRVAVRVQDQGPGIAPSERSQLFQRFSALGARRPDSAGLGLFIVKTLVDAQGGVVSASFPESGGTLFEVSFPAGERL